MIRIANIKDLESIMEIVRSIQVEMKEENNPQWNAEDDYPNIDKFMEDINNNALYVYEDSNIIKGFMSIATDNGEYDELLKTSNEPAYALHRLAIRKENRQEGLASKFFEYAGSLAKENNIKILKADTEKHNVKMNNLFLKLGFKKKGEFEYDDYPGSYIYYEKEIK